VNAVYPIHWNVNLLPEGLVIAAIAGIAGGLLGALFGLGLRRKLPEWPRLQRKTGRSSLRSPRPRVIAVGSLVALMGCFAFGLADRTPSGDSVQITLTEVKPAPQREGARHGPASARPAPPTAPAGCAKSPGRAAAWSARRSNGSARASTARPEPLPVYGKWKSALRIENGHTLLGVGIYAPADAAIPVAAEPALPSFTRPLRPGSRAAPARAKARHPRMALEWCIADRARPGPRLSHRARHRAGALLAHSAAGAAGATEAGPQAAASDHCKGGAGLMPRRRKIERRIN